MTQKAQLVLIALFLVLFSTLPLGAQEWKGKGRLQGKVTNPDGEPVADAEVFLLYGEDGDSGPPPISTDKKGRWSYLGLVGGSWTIRIVTEEYMISEGAVQVKEFGPPSPPIQIELKPPAFDRAMVEVAEQLDRGNALLQAGDHLAARAEYEKALPNVPEESKASLLRALAQTWAGTGDNDRAVELLQESLALTPDDGLTRQLLINVLIDAGRKDEAAPLIEQMGDGETLDITTRLNLGIDLYNKMDMEPALVHFEKAIVDFPKEADPYYYRGMVKMNQGINDQAIESFRKYLELAPEDSPTRAEVQQFLEYLESQ